MVQAHERRINQAAKFHPPGQDPACTGLPALEVGGALVFGYIRDGVLRVSIDLDTVNPALTHGPHNEVHIEVTCQGSIVWEAEQAAQAGKQVEALRADPKLAAVLQSAANLYDEQEWFGWNTPAHLRPAARALVEMGLLKWQDGPGTVRQYQVTPLGRATVNLLAGA